MRSFERLVQVSYARLDDPLNELSTWAAQQACDAANRRVAIVDV
jgi:hypothetical protein